MKQIASRFLNRRGVRVILSLTEQGWYNVQIKNEVSKEILQSKTYKMRNDAETRYRHIANNYPMNGE